MRPDYVRTSCSGLHTGTGTGFGPLTWRRAAQGLARAAVSTRSTNGRSNRALCATMRPERSMSALAASTSIRSPRCSTASPSTQATESTGCCPGTVSPITPYPTQPDPARAGSPNAYSESSPLDRIRFPTRVERGRREDRTRAGDPPR